MLSMPKTVGWRNIRKKPSGKYEARWLDESGKVRAKVFIEKAHAIKFADDMGSRVGNAVLGIAGVRVSIDEAVKAFLERRLDPKTTALNERRINEFRADMTDVKWVEQLTDRVINQYDAKLEAAGHNPGGRNHHLKIIRAFCRFCIKKHWLGVDPFVDFNMPKSVFEGRPLTEEEFNLMCSIGWVGGNAATVDQGIGWQGGNQFKDVDLWLRRAFILGRETMLRISQVWKLTPSDFREPDQLHIEGIKGQETVTITLTPSALAVIREILPGCMPGQRLFSYWDSVESMRTAVYKKSVRVGLRKESSDWPRFHDVCKVTRVSQLDSAGFSVKEIEQVSNTTARTLLDHYIKPDRSKTFEKYRTFAADRDSKTDNGRLVIRPPADHRETISGGNSGIIDGEQGVKGSSGNS